ncbi:MAG: hypothetical protein IJO32_02725 [Bacilli bacterium]|nr:hypothetical protein [Bacilli bacterium]
MKKFLIFTFLIFATTGCSISKLNMDDRDTLVNTILESDIKLYNRISKGYKYYLPKGIAITDYQDYNETLLADNNTYYLYVDIVSYYYNTKESYTKDINSIYYEELNINDKTGYIDIVKTEDRYLIKYNYNFAKMETLVEEKYINIALKDMTYILSSLQYNKTIIDSLIGENVLNYEEEKYQINKPKENEQTFLDYVNTFDTYKGEVDENINDSDTIKDNTVNKE